MMHDTYLPFSEEQLMNHFAEVKVHGKCKRNPKHLEYYINSIERYKRYLKDTSIRKGRPLKEAVFPCQIEKDEKFWIATCMMTLYYSPNRMREFVSLFTKAYAQAPPIEGLNSWEECFDGQLYLFFEPNLPSPQLYKEWLSKHLRERQFIPHILYSAEGKNNLEGATNVDTLLINRENGFAVIIEAKVLSDISVGITYDVIRNQIARSIDVMLMENPDLCHPLNLRKPEKTLFLLVTPRLFKDNPSSRLYGFKIKKYQSNPDSLRLDLPHRPVSHLESLHTRIGWLTWEDFRNVNESCCPWLK